MFYAFTAFVSTVIITEEFITMYQFKSRNKKSFKIIYLQKIKALIVSLLNGMEILKH